MLVFRSIVTVALLGLAVLVANTAAAAPGILVLGDSLSAAYGIARSSGWVTLLEKRLAQEKIDYSVVNASISGETTSGGRARLTPLLDKHRPKVVLIALGSNDGLRGLPVKQMRDNLDAMLRAAKARGAKPVLIGAKLPPNWGPEYNRDFEGAFAELAKRHKAALLPFLLDGVAERDEMFQPDRLHPTAEAQPLLLDNVWAVLRPVL